MSYEVSKQETIKEILENPAGFLMDQFKEGGVFHGEAYGFDASDLENLPVIVRLTVRDSSYLLKVVSWWLGDTCYRKIEYCSDAKAPEGGEPSEWRRCYVYHDEIQLFHGEWWELEQAAVGMATNEWREITVDNTRYTPDGRYAWFFPCGLKPAMRREGMALHVNNRPNSKEA